MKISAGIIIRYNNSILLCHPTNASWKGTFSFPKGEVNPGEDLIQCAIRECFEETGIKVNSDKISKNFCVIYDTRGKITKKVYLYQIKINSLSEIGLDDLIIDKSQLQLDEIDWAGFIDLNDIDEKIFWRFKPILNEIFN